MRQMPAHAEIDDNEAANKLAKEARDLNNNTISLFTLEDAIAIASYRFKENTIRVDQKIYKIDVNREKLLRQLRTGHFGGIQICADNTRTYVKCKTLLVKISFLVIF